MGIFKFNFMPRDERFYTFFEELAQYCVDSANLIGQLGDAKTDADFEQISAKPGALKKLAKTKYEDLSAQLCRSFITPFDREDLLLLGSSMYRSIKLAEKIQKRVIINRLDLSHESFLAMTSIVQKEAVALKALIHSFNKHRLKDMQQENRVLHELEDQADELLGTLLYSLSKESLSVYDLLLRKDVYEMFERLTDRYRDCGNLALQIVLKHT